MIATLIIQELRSFFNTPFYWTLTTKAAKEYISCRYLFQLTASRRGWQIPFFKNSIRIIISTHSLTKRLTVSNVGDTVTLNISTHSLTKRLTMLQTKIITKQLFQLTASRRGWRRSSRSWWKSGYFNSQPHEEADEKPFQNAITETISTHSLTKRLTALFSAIWHFSTFQLTASRRGWQIWHVFSRNMSEFQLTASRRGWRKHHLYCFFHNYFKSQPHEEADYYLF